MHYEKLGRGLAQICVFLLRVIGLLLVLKNTQTPAYAENEINGTDILKNEVNNKLWN